MNEKIALLKQKIQEREKLTEEITALLSEIGEEVSPYKPGEIIKKPGGTYTGKDFQVEKTVVKPRWDKKLGLLVVGEVIFQNGRRRRDSFESWEDGKLREADQELNK